MVPFFHFHLPNEGLELQSGWMNVTFEDHLMEWHNKRPPSTGLSSDKLSSMHSFEPTTKTLHPIIVRHERGIILKPTKYWVPQRLHATFKNFSLKYQTKQFDVGNKVSPTFSDGLYKSKSDEQHCTHNLTIHKETQMYEFATILFEYSKYNQLEWNNKVYS